MTSRVPLPAEVKRPFRVFVNGVRQDEGSDFRVEDHTLVFERDLRKEGRLGAVRWTAIFLGLFGTYRQNDSVDVHWDSAEGTRVVVGLDIIPPEAAG